MPRRLLNIASIFCLIACVALMGLWVRSYYIWGGVKLPLMRWQTDITSIPGRVQILERVRDAPPIGWNWFGRPYTANEVQIRIADAKRWGGWGFFSPPTWNAWAAIVPYWFLVLTAGSLAMAFQLRSPPRFTLRSLFIATTFLAVVLGIIAWLDRAWIGK